MKFTIYNGSPQAERSATGVMVSAFLRGAEKAGAETEQVYLAKKNIGYCQGCFACWFQTPGE